MPAKKVDPKAKEKRQKIIAAGGAVLLLALLAIQVPRTMKMMNAQAASAEPPVDIGAPIGGADPSQLPTPGSVGAGGAQPVAEGTLVDSDPAPPPDTDQLIAFGRFASKDPFKQQIDIRAAGEAAGAGTDTEEAPADRAPPPATGGQPGAVPGTPGAAPPAVPSGPFRQATIAVNGTEETVALRAEFPQAEPVFKLMAITRDSVRLAIAGGAFASGDPTMTLKRGKAVTLMNTADGARYELKLVSVG